jgi:DNA-binding LacI/PurR family transcriptional regulator
VAPNDWHANLFLDTLTALGVKIPRHLSMVSFDNMYHYSYSPITTVDFGHGELGHQTFHAIMNDVEPNTTGSREITARPLLIDRGSVRTAGRNPPNIQDKG